MEFSLYHISMGSVDEYPFVEYVLILNAPDLRLSTAPSFGWWGWVDSYRLVRSFDPVLAVDMAMLTPISFSAVIQPSSITKSP